MTTQQAVFKASATPLSTNNHLLRWVEKMADLTKPAAIHWVDGSQEENDALCQLMVDSGTFTRLNKSSGQVATTRVLTPVMWRV